MKRRLAGLAVLAAILTLGAIACGAPVPEPPPPTTAPRVSPPPPPPAPTEPPAVSETGSGQAAGAGTPFSVTLQDVGGSGEYKFDPEVMTFSVGDTVTFTLTSETEYHTFEVDDLDIFWEVEAEDTQTFPSFTFEEPGEYELLCTPHLTQGMSGVIIVQ